MQTKVDHSTAVTTGDNVTSCPLNLKVELQMGLVAAETHVALTLHRSIGLELQPCSALHSRGLTQCFIPCLCGTEQGCSRNSVLLCSVRAM